MRCIVEEIEGKKHMEELGVNERIIINHITLRLLMSYVYGAPILDVSRSHTTMQHSR